LALRPETVSCEHENFPSFSMKGGQNISWLTQIILYSHEDCSTDLEIPLSYVFNCSSLLNPLSSRFPLLQFPLRFVKDHILLNVLRKNVTAVWSLGSRT
jgi:hypothetical protein